MIQKNNKQNSIESQKIGFDQIIKRYGYRRALIFVILAVVFSLLILIYNALITGYVRENIQVKSEINALNSAEEVEIYLSTGKDVIEVSEYNLAKLVESGASDEEILDFLTYETDTVQASILPATTGIYGCIRGKYFDGSGWDPGVDYVPQERPWYTEGIAGGGDIVLINPYFDLFSQEVVMTIAKALPDGENVVAVDITLGYIQEIIEEGVRGDRDTTRMIISSNGLVVAHSEIDERGKNYLDETDTFGHYIFETVRESGYEHADITYKGDHYSIYSVPIGKDWYSISIVNSNDMYRTIRTMLAIGIGFMLATFVIFTVIMLISGKRAVIADKLQSILNSSADIYMTLCDLDVINNEVTGIKNVNPAIAKAVESCDHNMKELFNGIMSGLPESPTKQAAVEFTDLNTIDERMRDIDTDVIEYISYGNIWVRARLVVSERTPDGKVSHVLWMLEDIDKEKKEREELIDMSERALAASEAKSQFLSNMSHEIRTPINAILGMNEVVLRDSSDEHVIELSENIRSSGNTLLGLVNNILDFSKIESGKLEIMNVEYDLASVLNDLVNLIRPRLDPKGLEFILDIDHGIPRMLFGDDVRLRQVITNILTNAAKYTEKGSVTFAVTYDRMEYDQNSVILHVSVKDTGIGIKKEDMDKLFSEFERIEEKRNRNIEGTGLGMAITQSLLALMDSSLKVDSIYGEGSEFSFDITQKVMDWTPIGDFEESYKKSLSQKKGYHKKFTAPDARLLVVDDTPMNIIVFTSLLEPTEIVIDSAESSKAGMELALKNKYDIIFLDHMMPDKDGIETLHELKSCAGYINTDTPHIVLTANAIAGAKDKYLEEGFDDYFSKPIDSAKLEQMIVSYLPGDKIIAEADEEEQAVGTPDDKAGETAENETAGNSVVTTTRMPALAHGESCIPDFIFSLLDINPMEGIKRCGSEKIYLNALIAFARSIRPTINAARGYIKANNMDDLFITIQSVKAAAQMVGADRIVSLAIDLEKEGTDHLNYEKMNELVDRCIEMENYLAPLMRKA